jgi:hypothetical protein
MSIHLASSPSSSYITPREKRNRASSTLRPRWIKFWRRSLANSVHAIGIAIMIRRISPILSQAWANHQHGQFGIAGSRHGGGNAPILELVKVTASSIFEVVLLSFVGYLMARRGIIDKKTQTVG